MRAHMVPSIACTLQSREASKLDLRHSACNAPNLVFINGPSHRCKQGNLHFRWHRAITAIRAHEVSHMNSVNPKFSFYLGPFPINADELLLVSEHSSNDCSRRFVMASAVIAVAS